MLCGEENRRDVSLEERLANIFPTPESIICGGLLFPPTLLLPSGNGSLGAVTGMHFTLLLPISAPQSSFQSSLNPPPVCPKQCQPPGQLHPYLLPCLLQALRQPAALEML